MKDRFLKTIALLLVIVMCVSLLSACGSSTPQDTSTDNQSKTEVPEPGNNATNDEEPEKTEEQEDTEDDGMTDEQKASLEMLNLLGYLVQEIHDARHNRAALEETLDGLINNLEPLKVDAETLSFLKEISGTITKFKMNETALNRLEALQEQSIGYTILSIMPPPSDIVGAATGDPLGLILGIADSTLEAVEDETSPYYSLEELQYLQAQWDLEDSEEAELINSRVNMFSYLVTIAQSLPQGTVLFENDFEEFVSHTMDTSGAAKLDWLERNQERYQYLGYYWLELADSYFENEDYKNCLSAIAEYRDMEAGIFNLDERLAQSMPRALIAAKNTLSGNEYETAAADYLETLVNNIGAKEWELRYTAVIAYIELYNETGNKEYLEKAYNEAKENIEYLVPKQKEQNRAYINNEVVQDEDSTDADDKGSFIDTINQFLKKKRETELPPVNEALMRNCEILFEIAEELEISDSEKRVIDSLLHDDAVFLTYELDSKFSFNKTSAIAPLSEETMSYSGTMSDQKFTLPVVFAPAGTKISAEVVNKGEKIILDEWTVHEVNRNNSKDIGDFEAVWTCKASKSISFKEGDTVTIQITPPGAIDESDKIIIKYVVDKSNVFGVHFKQVD